ncbi:MAG: TonB-dependent receptor [Gammaproteobacteria bacterium]|nr:MAG: TonB-dependent receptor [Gammaproteobacteria bacterium]
MKNKASRPLFHLSLLSLSIASAMTLAAEPAKPLEAEEVVVTGYRGSLQSATNAKRESTALVESVFAEDIGKFSDSNIAEAINRMPGVQINRDPFGEGVNVSVRGLGTSFTKVLLNGSQVAVATSGTIDTQNQNREVDLNLFPTELFTRFDIQKTPTANMLEGGISGIVNIRAARPFDYKDDGFHINLNAQNIYTELQSTNSPKFATTASWRNDTFGALLGVAHVDKKLVASGYETIGYSNLNTSHRICGTTPGAGQTLATTGSCNTTGSNNWFMAGLDQSVDSSNFGYGKVPVNAGAGLTDGEIIDQAWLLAHNPGLDITQISNALMPRLGRQAYMSGTDGRTTGLASFEFRPSDEMQFYVDVMATNDKKDVDRLAMTMVGRNGSMIPLNMQLDSHGVVDSGTFANVQFFQEARPYKESAQFYNVNPGAHFEFGDSHMLDIQANRSRSDWFRESPTVMVATQLNKGIYVDYKNGTIPTFDVKDASGKVDFNNTELGWAWNGGRLNISNEKRHTETDGAHVDYRFGDDDNNIKFGLAYDTTTRDIVGLDNSARWEDVVCRDGLDANGDSPATGRKPCNGLNPNSLVPQSALSSYLEKGPGFITVQFDKFKSATNYYGLRDSAPEGGGSSTGASTAQLDELTKGAYVEFNTTAEVVGHEMRFNMGARYIETDQNIAGPVVIPAQPATSNTPAVPQQRFYVDNPTNYNFLLPSFNATFKVTDDVVLRFAASRTMTRPNPSAMLPATNFSDPSAQNASYGNPALSPYLSTNIDFGGEWYTGDEGYVGATLFGKQMTGFTVSNTFTVPFSELLVAVGNPTVVPYGTLSVERQALLDARGGASAPILVSQQVNAPGNLEIEGAELTWVQPLDFLFNGLGFNANYTHIYQRGEGAGAPAKAIGVSPQTYNFTAYWENYGASVRLTYVWNDEQTSSGPNQNGILGAELMTDARGQLDLSSSYEFDDVMGKPQVSFNVSNITNEPLRMTFAYDSATYSSFKTGYIATLGLKASF